jgi:hypothetical protein
MIQELLSAPLSEALDPPSVASSSVYRGQDSLGCGQPEGRETHSSSHQSFPMVAPMVSPTRGRTEVKATDSHKRKRSRTVRREKLSAKQQKKAAAKKKREKIQRVLYVYRQQKEMARRSEERKKGIKRTFIKKKRVKVGTWNVRRMGATNTMQTVHEGRKYPPGRKASNSEPQQKKTGEKNPETRTTTSKGRIATKRTEATKRHQSGSPVPWMGCLHGPRTSID